MRTGAEIERMTGLLKRFRTLDFISRPARTFLSDWADEVLTEASNNARVFTGETKDSLEIEMGPGAYPKWAQVFSEDPKARWLEYGTGLLSEDPESSGQRYFPPVSGVRDWAEYKNLDPGAVAVGIFERGGTPPTHFISDAIASVNSRLGSSVGRFGKMIEAEAGRG